MSLLVQARWSDSPYVESIWRGSAQSDTSLLCAADGCWKLLFAKLHGTMHVSVEGPMTRPVPMIHREGTQWLVIKFELGTFLRHVPTRSLLDGEVILSQDRGNSFQLGGFTWQVPEYDNAETFIDWLVREEVLLSDPVVMAVRASHPHQRSSRTVRHRFIQATGLTQVSITYRGGPLACDLDETIGIRAGDRAPDAPCIHAASSKKVRLFDLFRGPHWTLLAFGDRSLPRLPDVYNAFIATYTVIHPGVTTRACEHVLIDVDGDVHRFYGVSGDVRPDGYVGLTAGKMGQGPILDYLRTTLGEGKEEQV